ncbi:2-oxo-tetronate isomerase [Ralstonia solanacearum]|uniref:2-oxo-tetronate isomerase n=1 Tax=Ralstonia solanacearum TaxID=305 RepID=UPI000F615E28|nr:2-oxo-tetronate isomerase [Ralstonia solanacearum]
MPRFAANLTMMYPEHAFLDRFAAAARDGFEGVEFLFPYDYGKAELQARLEDNGLALALFNAPPGDWVGGERGIASLPGREDEFKRSIATALDYARALGNTRVHVVAGLIGPHDDRARHHATYVQNLAYAAHEAAGAGITIVLEPINTRDMPGFFLTHQAQAHAVCREVGAPNLKVQFDLYHAQIMEGDLSIKLRQYIDGIGHVQIASVPNRHEPDEGELNYPHLFALLDTLSYDGWVGCEYRPRAGTSEGLGWFRRWRERQR